MSKKWLTALGGAALALLPYAAMAAGAIEGEVKKAPINIPAIVMFFLFVGFTLFITYWAARRTKSAAGGFLYKRKMRSETVRGKSTSNTYFI